MTLIRGHWKLAVLCSALLGGVGWLAICQFSAGPLRADPPPEEQDGQETTPIDAETYCRVRALRQRLGVQNQSLAAMGCSESQATTVLQTLIEWYQANVAALETARGNKRAAAKALRLALRRVSKGPRDEELLQSIPGLRATFVQAALQEKSLLANAAVAIEAKLTASQKPLWQTIRAVAPAPEKYRYATGVTAEQNRALRVAVRLRARRLAAADSAEQQAQAVAEFQAVESDTLSAGREDRQHPQTEESTRWKA